MAQDVYLLMCMLQLRNIEREEEQKKELSKDGGNNDHITAGFLALPRLLLKRESG